MDKDREMETTERWIKQRDGNHREMDKDREMETTKGWKPKRDG